LVSTKSVAETADDRRLDPLAAQLGGHGRRALLRELLVGGGSANAVGEAEEHHLLAAVLLDMDRPAAAADVGPACDPTGEEVGEALPIEAA
jgi:hypothetical protein